VLLLIINYIVAALVVVGGVALFVGAL